MAKFIKMHGLGNDFAIFDGRSQLISLSRSQVIQMADRRRGIGFDQLCIIKPPQHPEADVFIEIINVDGAIVAACGNLTRCVALLIAEETGQSKIVIQTLAGLLRSEVLSNDTVSVNMGKPSYRWSDIPLSEEMDTMAIDFRISSLPPASVVSMGNPHCIFIVDDIAKFNIYDVGPVITTHPFFPEETNVELAQVLNRAQINMAIWERAIGYSVACGSGACAVVSVAYRKGLVDKQVQVDMPGGQLEIHINDQEEMIMVGQVSKSFSGNIDISLL